LKIVGNKAELDRNFSAEANVSQQVRDSVRFVVIRKGISRFGRIIVGRISLVV
jgi:hypothetical protein